jgi:hypothetical protein
VEWQQLGSVDPMALALARTQAHWAAQVLSAAGETLLPHRKDTSHTAMRWDPALAALVGEALGDHDPCRVALRVHDLTLLLVDANGRAIARETLAGRTLAEARAWAASALDAHARGTGSLALVHPGYALPDHPLAVAGRFEVEPDALAELARWVANADRELRAFAARTPGAGPVLCWPHHFDLATLVVLRANAAGEATRTLGAGLSPGDESIAEPYWYVNSWDAQRDPVDGRERLPALAAGEWFRGAWTGAVLRGSELVAAGGASAQRATLQAWLASATRATRSLLSSPSP